MIDDQNIESYIIDFLDGELDTLEQQALMDYIAANPSAHLLLEDYQQAIIRIEAPLAFPDKSTLLRKEEMTLSPRSFLKIGVAAAVLFGGVWGFMQWNFEKATINGQALIPHSLVSTLKINKKYVDMVSNTADTAAASIHPLNTTGVSRINSSVSAKVADGNRPSLQAQKQPADLNVTIDEYARMEALNMNELIRENGVLDYNVQIEAQYLKLDKPAPEVVSSREGIEVGVGSFTFNADYSKIAAFYDKIEKKKEKILDKIASLPQLEF